MTRGGPPMGGAGGCGRFRVTRVTGHHTMRVKVTRGARSQQPERAPALDRLGARVHVELRVELAHVGLDRVDRQEQLAADLGRREVARQEAQDGQLALVERLGERARRGAALEQVEQPAEERGVRGPVRRVGGQQLARAGDGQPDPDVALRLRDVERPLDAPLRGLALAQVPARARRRAAAPRSSGWDGTRTRSRPAPARARRPRPPGRRRRGRGAPRGCTTAPRSRRAPARRGRARRRRGGAGSAAATGAGRRRGSAGSAGARRAARPPGRTASACAWCSRAVASIPRMWCRATLAASSGAPVRIGSARLQALLPLLEPPALDQQRRRG